MFSVSNRTGGYSYLVMPGDHQLTRCYLYREETTARERPAEMSWIYMEEKKAEEERHVIVVQAAYN